MKIHMHTGENKAPDFRVDDKGTLWYKDRISVPKEGDFRQTNMDEAHNSAYSIHPGFTSRFWKSLHKAMAPSWISVRLITRRQMVKQKG
jgi:hypothetical protein